MQRKLLNPVFTSNVMRELTPLMFSAAQEVVLLFCFEVFLILT